MFFSLSITGLFSMWAIAPTSSNAEFNTRSVSASSVIIYFIVFNFSFMLDFICSSFCCLSMLSCIVFILNGFLPCNMNSLNWFNIPLFRSHPKYVPSFSFHILFLYIKLNIGNSSFWYFWFSLSTCFFPSWITSSSNFSSCVWLSEQSPNNVKYKFLDLFAK